MRRLAPLALSGICAGFLSIISCGLIDSDIADFDLSLPEKELVVDSSQWQLTEDETFPAVDCSENAGACSLGVSQVCGAEGICFSTCSEAQTCDLKVLVTLWHTFDLAKEKPELKEIEGKPIVSVDIDRIAYRISENTLNVDSPPLTVYVAPAGIMSPGDPQAEAIGTLPSIPAGMLVESQDVDLTPEGRELLAKYMKQYSTPFNLVVGAEVDLAAGDAVPTGRLTAVVLVTAVAGL